MDIEKARELIEEINQMLGVISPPVEFDVSGQWCSWCECVVALDKVERYEVDNHADDCPYRSIVAAHNKAFDAFKCLK